MRRKFSNGTLTALHKAAMMRPSLPLSRPPLTANNAKDSPMDVARHMTPDEFRRSGHAIIERIARYMEEVERYPVLSQAEPGSVRARLPDGRARAGRALRGPSARCRRDHRSRPHALAVPQLLCVLPGQCLRPLDPRRSSLLRVRGAGHALGDKPRLHRARDPRARLAGRPARTAGGVPLEHGRRRRHSGQRVEQHADRAHRRARARERRRDQ